ncbi:MAG: cyclic pyranopterin phosphate synthase MoaA, partial [Flavobacteriales bacterium]
HLRTCLYATSGLSILNEIRAGKSDSDIIAMIRSAIQHKHIDGFAAEKQELKHVSMAHIGG